jgi:serine/threonine-protein kinase HipA
VRHALIGNADMHLKNWSLIYPDTRTARRSPAYDFVATVACLAEDKRALSLARSKAYDSLMRDLFIRLAAKAQLPEKLTLDTMEETVACFSAQWRTYQGALDLKLRTAIQRHLKPSPSGTTLAPHSTMIIVGTPIRPVSPALRSPAP